MHFIPCCMIRADTCLTVFEIRFMDCWNGLFIFMLTIRSYNLSPHKLLTYHALTTDDIKVRNWLSPVFVPLTDLLETQRQKSQSCLLADQEILEGEDLHQVFFSVYLVE